MIILIISGQQWFRFVQNVSESELFTGETSKDNHSPGPLVRVVGWLVLGLMAL